jgi:transcription initiation factor IIE alpha subunit
MLRITDQVDFMASLLQPEKLSARVDAWIKAEIRAGAQHKLSAPIVSEILSKGEISRSEVQKVTGLKERAARDIIKSLASSGVIYSANKRAPLRLHFSAQHAEYWLPTLFAPR